MLCAAWERYNEDLLLESIGHYLEHSSNSNLLPKSVKQKICKKVNSDKNEIKAFDLAGDGWKNLWMAFAKIKTDSLHTPKSSNLDTMYKSYLGIDGYSNTFWKDSINDVNELVKLRGEIAHNGAEAKYVRINSINMTIDMIVSATINIDDLMARHLKDSLRLNKSPWETTYERTLKAMKERN